MCADLLRPPEPESLAALYEEYIRRTQAGDVPAQTGRWQRIGRQRVRWLQLWPGLPVARRRRRGGGRRVGCSCGSTGAPGWT